MKKPILLTLLAGAALLGAHDWDPPVILHVELPPPAEAVRELRTLADRFAVLTARLDDLLRDREVPDAPENVPAA